MICPICNKTSHADFRPFCSKRCADTDLNRWLNGQYAIGENGEISHNTDEHIEGDGPKIEFRFDN